MENKQFKLSTDYTGKFNMNSEEHGFNNLVICLHPFVEDIKCIGRLVQVRKKSGVFGTDTIFIRLMDGELQCWENQGFFSISEEHKSYLESFFKDIPLDKENIEYSINGKHKAKGFIVENMCCIDEESDASTCIITVTKK